MPTTVVSRDELEELADRLPFEGDLSKEDKASFTELMKFRLGMWNLWEELFADLRDGTNRTGDNPKKEKLEVAQCYKFGLRWAADRLSPVPKKARKRVERSKVEDGELEDLWDSVEGRQAGMSEEVTWVNENLRVPRLSAVDAAGIPSRGALSMLVWARGHETEFRQLYHSKLMPSRTALETALMSDSGREHEKLMGELLAASEGAG